MRIALVVVVSSCAHAAPVVPAASSATGPAPRISAPAPASSPGVTLAEICAWLPAAEQAYESRDRDTMEERGAPQCDVEAADGFVATPPWKRIGVLSATKDAHYSERIAMIAVETDGWWGGPDVARDAALHVVVRDVLPDPGAELVITIDESAATRLVVCTQQHRCSTPVVLERDGWGVSADFTGGRLVTTVKTGTPPADAVGSFPLALSTFDLREPE